MTLYALKPRFQDLLRPIVGRLASGGVTANQITLLAAAGSVAVGLAVTLVQPAPAAFLALPVWLFLRMALNAIDGMLAREFGQKSRLGAYLNELGDVISDAALVLPFATVAVFDGAWVAAVAVLAVITEVAGVLGQTVGASRRYDGPVGKSDRALMFGALALWIGLGLPLADWAGLLMPLIALGLVATVVRRVRAGLAEGGGR
ncbi:CDP-alcohol phosphatidyltransferase family protein [Mongoliimonas terrestris]|uniref:CDP-alcohol phosphatidyltransferase family protein n=1 Tax=Mongoliimonas terrestris TaxID=1709001 RepID=UPI000949983D|nr:CDP-alcohol phosphatidyltransferase family protein [Mongoliimonas terrestris]